MPSGSRHHLVIRHGEHLPMLLPARRCLPRRDLHDPRPCIAPVVPLVLGAASTGGPRRSLGILAGFGLSFLAVTVILASVFAAAGLTTDRLRIASAIFLALVGLTIALPGIGSRLGERLAPLANLGHRAARRRPGTAWPEASCSAARSG